MVVLNYGNIWPVSINVNTPFRRNFDHGFFFDALFLDPDNKSKTTIRKEHMKPLLRHEHVQIINHNSLYFFVNIFQDRTLCILDAFCSLVRTETYQQRILPSPF
jgi:hypothetical protein